MRNSIWTFLVSIFASIAILGVIFIVSISIFFYNFNIENKIKENTVLLKMISNTVAGPSWTLKELYPGVIENTFRGALEIDGMKFIRLVNSNVIEKSNESDEIGVAVENMPIFEKNVSVRDGIFNGEKIKEFSVKTRDGSKLWAGISFKKTTQEILLSALKIGTIGTIAFLLIMILVFSLVKNFFVQPLVSLMNAFEELKKRNYKIYLNENPIKEMNSVLLSFNDTAKKIEETESQLSDELKRTKEVDRLKSEFISVAAHQLRTPLSAVKWTLKMMIDEDLGTLNPEQKTFLMRGYEGNERMIRLVNDMLNVVRIEEGRFGYDFSLIKLEDLVENVVQDFIPIVKNKHIDLVFKKPEKELPKVWADSTKMRLAISNLVDNAIKYTPEKGSVTIEIKQGKIDLEVSVKDTGLGIPSDQQKSMFTKFFRAENVVRVQTDGTGLGLFIVKNIIEKHKGKIWFASEENKGTTMYFTVPIS